MQTNIWPGMPRRKAVGFSPTSTTPGRFFRTAAFIRERLTYVQLEFGESAASIRVRLLIKCGFINDFTQGGGEKNIAPTATKNFLFLWLLVQFFFHRPLLYTQCMHDMPYPHCACTHQQQGVGAQHMMDHIFHLLPSRYSFNMHKPSEAPEKTSC